MVPLPQLKIAGFRLCGKPLGRGRKEQGCRAGPWGARLGRKCPGAWLPPPPTQRLLSADTDPWKAPSAPFTPTWGGIFWVPQVRPQVPGWARLTPADDVLQGLNWSPAVDSRGPDEGSSSRLSVCAPGDDLTPTPTPAVLGVTPPRKNHSLHKSSLRAHLPVVGTGLSMALVASLLPGRFLGTNKGLTQRGLSKEQTPSLSTWRGRAEEGSGVETRKMGSNELLK